MKMKVISFGAGMLIQNIFCLKFINYISFALAFLSYSV